MGENKRQIPKVGEIYKHFKGNLYQVVTIAVHTETSDKLVVYKSIENPERVFARPVDMFMSKVDRLKYPFVRAKYRFTLMVEAGDEEKIEKTEATELSEDNEKEKEEVVNEKQDECADDTAVYKKDGELVIDPIIEAILDEKEFTKKIENFELLRGKCTDEMLTTLAISLDIQLSEGTVEEKYADILKTLRMHEKYESARLR